MLKQTAIANGADPIQQSAAAEANAIQDAVNLVAIVGCLQATARTSSKWRRPHQSSRLAGLHQQAQQPCRMSFEREIAALEAIGRIERGEIVEYEVIPI